MRTAGAVGRLVLVAALALATRAPAEPLRVASFNMLHGGLTSELNGDAERLEDRLRLAAADLAALDLDILGLQEASVGAGRGDTAARLAVMLGLPYVTGPPPGGWFARLTATVLRLADGPALVSRYPQLRSRAWPLPRCGDTSARMLLCTEVAAPTGPVTACSTHLDGSACQLAALAERLRRRCATTPLVLFGDLNATEAEPAMADLLARTGLRDAFRVANPAAGGLTVWQPVTTARPTVRRRVDYVLVAPGGGWGVEVQGSRVVLDRPHPTPDGPLWPSDHRAVLAEVALLPRPADAAPADCVPLGGS